MNKEFKKPKATKEDVNLKSKVVPIEDLGTKSPTEYPFTYFIWFGI